MVSCLAYAAEGTHLVAAGSYCGDVALYDSRTWEMLYLLKGHKGGVTQVWGKCGAWVRLHLLRGHKGGVRRCGGKSGALVRRFIVSRGTSGT